MCNHFAFIVHSSSVHGETKRHFCFGRRPPPNSVSQTIAGEEEGETSDSSLIMDDQRLRKALSDASIQINKFLITPELGSTVEKIDEVEQVICGCCGLKEDCTQSYISEVKKTYSDKWVCGLCSEAVKEKLTKAPETTPIQEAVGAHGESCQSFNTTTRLNPKLSLTCAMRDIAKRSRERRTSTNNSSVAKFARSTSCVPRIDLK